MDWGNNQQRGNKVYNHQESGIKSKTVDKMEDYVGLKKWLIEQ